jgi:uncharacterized membrane protein YgcG
MKRFLAYSLPLFLLAISLVAQDQPQQPEPDNQQPASNAPDSQPASNAPDSQPDQTGPAPQQAPPQSPDQLQQLVAPIALYPDSLVAQILTGSTYPTQIVEANRWLHQNQNLQGKDLADAVDQQNWDPSVKALTQFPSVLANLDQNLSWTQSLGDAYYNQPQDVMDAIQVMRRKAQEAGNLKSTPQQVVTANGPDILIAPSNPQYVYVPEYDPWLIYGPPVAVWPGFVYSGLWLNRPFFGFGVGFNLGFWSGFGWGWPAWGFDWRAHHVFYHNAPYFTRGPAFFNHGGYRPPPFRGSGAPGYRAGAPGYRGAAPGYRGGVAPHGVEPPVGRGFGSPRGNMGVHSNAFSGYAHGGVTRGYESRGMGSMGGVHGGGGGHAGGGGGHGGGGHR